MSSGDVWTRQISVEVVTVLVEECSTPKDKRTEKDSGGFMDSKVNKWVGS